MGAEKLRHFQHVETVRVVRLDLYHRQPTEHGGILVQPLHRDDVGHLFELLDHLVHKSLIAVDHNGNPRTLRRLRDADGQAVDIEFPPGKHARDPHQNARLVMHIDGKHVPHKAASPKNLAATAAANTKILWQCTPRLSMGFVCIHAQKSTPLRYGWGCLWKTFIARC